VTGPLRFDPAEVAGLETNATDAEVSEAMLAARALEGSLSGTSASVPVTADLADRIMASVRRAPAPRSLGILATLRRRPSPAGVIDTLAIAWQRVMAGGPLGFRASALAYVAAVVVLAVSISGVAAYGAAGALGVLPHDSRQPDASLPLATPGALERPEASDEASREPGETEAGDAGEPADTTEPSQRAGASDDHGGSGSGSGGGGGSDDGQSAGPTSSGDHSGDGGGGGTPEPTGTPRASETPHPTGTPNASESHTPSSSSGDSSGSGGSSGSTDGGGDPAGSPSH
jgi:hypothetical protein